MGISRLAAIGVAVVALAGCSTTQQGANVTDRARPARPAAMAMAGMDMPMTAADGRPSPAAAMICSDEIGHTVRRTFGLSAVPPRRRMWMPPVFGCTWQLPHSRLQLAVDDTSRPGKGRRQFARMHASLAGASRIRGMESFGFPAFQAPAGVVVFLKDGKVLSVDARTVARQDLPADFTREEVASAVAAAVIACWSE